MKLKIEYLILLIVIAALIAYLALHKSDRTLYELPQLPAIGAQDISRLEIAKAGETIVVKKQDDAWHIEPGDHAADGTKIRDMVDVLGNLAVTALVSESGSYERYDLNDDRKIAVKAWAGGTVRRDFYIGKTAPTYHHTFVRLAGNDNVFHARGDFRRTFDLSRDDLRDKTVMAFDAGDIQEISITRKGITERFTQVPLPRDASSEGTAEPQSSEGASAWKNSRGAEIDGSRVEALLSDLSSLKCESYLEGKRKADFADPIITLMLKGTREYLLTIYRKEEEADEGVPALSSATGEPFLLTDQRIESLQTAIDGLTEMSGTE